MYRENRKNTIVKKGLLVLFLLLLFTNLAMAKLKYPEDTDEQSRHIVFPKQNIGYNARVEKELFAYLRQFPNLQSVDMLHVRLHKDMMFRLFDSFPKIDFGFSFLIEGKRVTSHIRYFSTLHSTGSTRYSESLYSMLRVCKNLQILDLGHNKIRNIDFIKDLRQLRILILSDNQIKDISPLSGLYNLEYFEVFRNQISDIGALRNLTKLKDINIVGNPVADVSPLYVLPNIERLWMSDRYVDRVQEIRDMLPNTLVNFTNIYPTGDGWREHPRYFDYTKLLREQNRK